MPRIFNRHWEIQVGTKRLSSEGTDFSINFQVAKSLDREPNTLVLKIANLSESSRSLLQEDDAQISLIAGYDNLQDIIFSGDISDAYSYRDGAEIWITVEAEDGGNSYSSATLERSWATPVPVEQVLMAAGGALNVGFGNSLSAFEGATLSSGQTIFANGTTLTGPAWRSLDRLCRSCNLRWSIQNGNLQIRTQGRPAEVTAIRLAPSTGLIGSPKRGKRDREGKFSVEAKSLLRPGLYPGRVVSLESDTITSNLLIQQVRFAGDSRGQDWYSTLTLEEYDHA